MTSSQEQNSKFKRTTLITASLAVGAVGVGGALGYLLNKYLSVYKPPDVWTNDESSGGKFSKINRPTAGPRITKALPRGEHALQLYSLGTPNGQKVTILLEELNLRYGIEYDAWIINIMECDQFTSGFVSANPNSKIPALIDYSDPKNPVRVFESAAIMMYLCDKYDTLGALLPKIGDDRRAECISWLFWTQGSAPLLGGGFGHFYNYAPFKIKYAINRYSMETKRQLDVLDRHLGGTLPNIQSDEKEKENQVQQYLCGNNMTIADLCCYPWYGRLVEGKLYSAGTFLNVTQYKNVFRWAQQMSQRKAVQRGGCVNKVWGDGPQLKERHSAKDFDALGI